MNPENPQTVFGWLVTAIGGLAAATTFLWKRSEDRNAAQISDMQKRLDECSAASDECYEDRLQINSKVSQLEGRLIEIERKAGGPL
jgi:hypothetical protein